MQRRVQRFADPTMFVEQGEGHLGATLMRLAELPAMFIAEPPPANDALAAIGIVLLPVALLAAAGRAARRNAALWVIWFLAATLPVLATDVIRGTLRLNIMRYTLLASPAIYALLATVSAGLRPLLRPWIPALAVIAAALASPIAYLPNNRPDWRAFGADIRAIAHSGDLLAIAPNTPDADVCQMWFTLCTHYARPLTGPVIVLTLPRPPDVSRALDTYRGVVVVTFDADNDGIRPNVVPLAVKIDPRVGQVYRFEPSRPADPIE